MVFSFEYFLTTWDWTLILFTCFLAFFIWLVYHKKRSKKLHNRSNNEFVAEDASDNTCTSLSCVRCSKSVFSTEKLLSRLGAIQRSLQLDEAVSRRIKNGISGNRCKQNGFQSPTVFYLEKLPSKAWYTAKDFPREVSILEKKPSMDIFHSEFLDVYKNLGIGWVSNEVSSGGWYLFYLVNQGVRIEDNCKRCPKTTKLIRELPSFMAGCAFGNVMFSVLLPKTIINQHCGPTNVRLRCHVPLKAPDGYFICVADEEKSWKENKVLIFDDSFYHKVYHHGDEHEPRVVLMIDLWHPCLGFQEKEIIRTLFTVH